MKHDTIIWLDIAKEDYKNMQVMKESGSYRGSVLFAQQCVEKVLKAYITEFTDKKVKKIHFIEVLLQDADLDPNEIGNLDVKKLSRAYGWARYKDLSTSHFQSAEDVDDLLIMAEKLYQWIHNKFPKT